MADSSRVAIIGPAGWTDRLTFSPAVRAGKLLFLSGMTASDPDGRLVGAGDIAAQARCIYTEKLLPLLRAAGALIEIRATAVLP